MSKVQQISIGRQVLFAFGALCLVLVTIGGFFFFSLRAIEHRHQTQQACAHHKWEVIDKLPKNVGLMQAEVLQHVLTTDAGEMERRDQIIRGLKESNARMLADYETLVDNEKERRLYARVMQARNVYLEQTEELLVLSRVNRNDEAAELAKAKQSPAYVEYHAVADEMIEAAEENARQSRADTSRLIGQLGKDGGVLIGLAMLITLGTGLTVARVTRGLRADNETLQTEITQRRRTEESLRESEARIRLLVKSSDIGLWDWNLVTNEVFFSTEWKRQLGYTDAELPSRFEEWESRLHPEEREPTLASVKDYVEGRRADYEVEFRLCHKDGSWRWILTRADLSHDATGQPVRIMGCHIDITERKRAEEALRKNEQFLSLIVRATNDALWDWDLATGGVQWSGNLEKIFGVGTTEAETLLEVWSDAVHPDDCQRVLSSIEASFGRADLSWSAEYRHRCADGSYAYYLDRASIIRDERGKPVRVLGAKTDLTERKQAEEELLLAKSAAEAATRTKSEFLANMSHEIRTPMNGVMGMANLLLDSKLSDDQRHYAEAIGKSGESLLSVINDILDFSKIEAGKLSFETLDFDLHEVVEGCLELLARRAQDKGLELACLIESDVPAQLRGDPGRLRQILTNLAGNAIKFTERGEVVVKVSLESETEMDAVLRFEVHDTGIGISVEAQARIFRPFSQADGSTTRKYGGTGLGLAISKQLIEMMHGQIGIESTSGQGSAFWFTAKLGRQPEGAGSHPIVRGDLVNLRVLIVDDNETNRQILQHQTRAWKMRSNAVVSAAEALAELRRAQTTGDSYQVVLLDLHMPGTDGLELARSIRTEKQLADVRLVLLSSMGERLHADELKAAGIDNCLVKPVKQSRLFDCLATLMGSAPAEPGIKAEKVLPLLASSAPARQNLRILLAEDNIVNQEVGQGLLRKLGYRADAVADGTEVLEVLRRIRYDVVLMDCQMPELDGYEATRRIRQFEQKGITPFDWKAPIHIIAMTANAMEGDREKCLIAGMNDYLSKPVRQSELKAALESCSAFAAESKPETVTAAPNESAARATLDGAVQLDGGPTESRARTKSPAEPMLDFNQLRDVTNNEPAVMRRLVGLYLTQAAPILDDLDVAIQAGASGEIARLAHKLVGSSISFGVQAFTEPLRELEQIVHAGDLARAPALLEDVRHKFPRVQGALDQFLQTIPS